MLTRRYHGMLIASLPAPLGRMVMLNHLLERVRLPGKGVIWLGDEDEVAGPNAADRTEHLAEFRLELGLPVWLYRVDGFAIEKRIVMPHGQNTVHVTYRVARGDGDGAIQPAAVGALPRIRIGRRRIAGQHLHHRGDRPAATSSRPGRICRSSRMLLIGDAGGVDADEKGLHGVPYQMEETRGYQWKGSLWSPGYFRADAEVGEQVSLIASAEPWETVAALSPEGAARAEIERRRRLIGIANVPDDFAAELVLAADQFIIQPAGRVEERPAPVRPVTKSGP